MTLVLLCLTQPLVVQGEELQAYIGVVPVVDSTYCLLIEDDHPNVMEVDFATDGVNTIWEYCVCKYVCHFLKKCNEAWGRIISKIRLLLYILTHLEHQT